MDSSISDCLEPEAAASVTASEVLLLHTHTQKYTEMKCVYYA